MLTICEVGHTSRGHFTLWWDAGPLRKWSRIMAHSVERSMVERVNVAVALVLGILWTALAICVLGALAYDIHYWFEG